MIEMQTSFSVGSAPGHLKTVAVKPHGVSAHNVTRRYGVILHGDTYVEYMCINDVGILPERNVWREIKAPGSLWGRPRTLSLTGRRPRMFHRQDGTNNVLL